MVMKDVSTSRSLGSIALSSGKAAGADGRLDVSPRGDFPAVARVLDPGTLVIGKVSQVLNTPGHDLYVVQGPGGEVLIPAVSEYVGEINLEEGFMVVTPPEF